MNQAADPVRLFFALWPDAALRQSILAAAKRVESTAPQRLVLPENLHATLAFIGEVSVSQLPRVMQIGTRVAACARGFALHFDAYEYWPKPEVIVAAARTFADELAALWQALHKELGEYGWAEQPKKLRPHITLLRHVTDEPKLPPLPAFDWRATEFCLVRSDTGGTQSLYTVLRTWPLLDDTQKT